MKGEYDGGKKGNTTSGERRTMLGNSRSEKTAQIVTRGGGGTRRPQQNKFQNERDGREESNL